MNELPLRLKTYLLEAAEKLRQVRLPELLGDELRRLAEQVDQPCVVAVVGRMKAGKSTFINALLSEDLAKVGATETTATINYFRYGQPNPARPVRCYWQNGGVTEEDQAFLDGLQGNDTETLRRSSGIRHLEYLLLNPYLERVVLVDTPGRCAVVDEHVQRTAEFLALKGQLRDRYNVETERLGSEADAVVYLIGQVARATDQAFLGEFTEVTGGRSKALNALGVLAKIDLQPGVMQRRHELAEQIGRQLKGSLNTVLPVSAGIQRAVDRLQSQGGSGIAGFLATLQRIPPWRLEKFLDNEEFYRDLEPEDCPVTRTERTRLLGDMPWAVFTTLVRSAMSLAFDPAATECEWRSLSGFDRLREMLDRHFIHRSQFLRCYRIVNDARRVLNTVRFQHLPEHRQREREQRTTLDRFLRFVRGAGGDPVVASQLEGYLTQQSGLQVSSEQIDLVWKGLDRRLAEFIHELDDMNADFEALRLLEDNATSFSTIELDELRTLFGLYGLETKMRTGRQTDISHLASRQQYWLTIDQQDTKSERRAIAGRAVACYGSFLGGL